MLKTCPIGIFYKGMLGPFKIPSEILKSKTDTANKAASDEKIAVEKEIDSCLEKLKGLGYIYHK